MKLPLLVSSLSLLSLGIVPVAIAQPASPIETDIETDINPTDTSDNNQSLPDSLISTTVASPPESPITNIPRLSEVEHLHTSADFLVQEPTLSEPSPTPTNQTEATPSQTNQADDEARPNSQINETEPSTTEGEEQDEIEITVTGEREIVPETSTPVYTITEEEIQKQGATSVSEVLRGLPGFAINDVGFGADIHKQLHWQSHTGFES